jgi:hypothetical protein
MERSLLVRGFHSLVDHRHVPSGERPSQPGPTITCTMGVVAETALSLLRPHKLRHVCHNT